MDIFSELQILSNLFPQGEMYEYEFIMEKVNLYSLQKYLKKNEKPDGGSTFSLSDDGVLYYLENMRRYWKELSYFDRVNFTQKIKKQINISTTHAAYDKFITISNYPKRFHSSRGRTYRINALHYIMHEFMFPEMPLPKHQYRFTKCSIKASNDIGILVYDGDQPFIPVDTDFSTSTEFKYFTIGGGNEMEICNCIIAFIKIVGQKGVYHQGIEQLKEQVIIKEKSEHCLLNIDKDKCKIEIKRDEAWLGQSHFDYEWSPNNFVRLHFSDIGLVMPFELVCKGITVKLPVKKIEEAMEFMVEPKVKTLRQLSGNSWHRIVIKDDVMVIDARISRKDVKRFTVSWSDIIKALSRYYEGQQD